MRSILSTLFSLCFFFSQGQNLKPHFFAIIVSDIEQSKRWYNENLGFEIVNEIDLMKERGFKQANLLLDQSKLELIQITNAISPTTLLDDPKSKLEGFFKVGFLVSDFDSTVERLRNMGVAFQGDVVADQNQKKMVILLDPDGNRIQLFEAN